LQTDHPYSLDDSDNHPTQPHLKPLTVASYQDLISAEPPAEEAPVDDDLLQQQKIKAILQEIFETLVLAVIIWGAVNFVTMRVVVDGISMEPNLFGGERLIVNRLVYRFFGEPERGDVIVFESPVNPKENLVKRVIGLPGETLTVEGGEVYINGVSLDEPYIAAHIQANEQGRWTIPAGYYFVMGDNRNRSSDSRSWGMLPQDLIMGKAWVVYWPPKALGLPPHHNFDSGSGDG
jgi:signal peptidase I